jgi:hypothetical protein
MGCQIKSTHLPQLQNYIAPVQEHTTCYVRNINSFTIDEIQYKLITECWDDIFGGFETNVTFSNLNKILMHVSLK